MIRGGRAQTWLQPDAGRDPSPKPPSPKGHPTKPLSVFHHWSTPTLTISSYTGAVLGTEERATAHGADKISPHWLHSDGLGSPPKGAWADLFHIMAVNLVKGAGIPRSSYKEWSQVRLGCCVYFSHIYMNNLSWMICSMNEWVSEWVNEDEWTLRVTWNFPTLLSI